MELNILLRGNFILMFSSVSTTIAESNLPVMYHTLEFLPHFILPLIHPGPLLNQNLNEFKFIIKSLLLFLFLNGVTWKVSDNLECTQIIGYMYILIRKVMLTFIINTNA